MVERHVALGQWLAEQALYRGKFMPGHYDEWVVDERQRLLTLQLKYRHRA